MKFKPGGQVSIPTHGFLHEEKASEIGILQYIDIGSDIRTEGPYKAGDF
jgi:hypothetical protein